MKEREEKVYQENPKTGDKIVDVHETVGGYVGTLVKKDGRRIKLNGTWAFTPGLSFYAPDPKTGFGPYVTVGGYWQ